MGMIYKCFSAETHLEEVQKLADQLSNMPTLGLALTKKALNAAMSNDLDQQLALEEKFQIEAGSSHDYKEGVSAFMEKRAPKFIGK
jgi:2-(1,2-epoxy-1,2-dihydrophenyl)acetyl-CoA isomerase